MPHFDENGEGTWICQVCGIIYPDSIPSEWRPDITGHESAGNVCPTCLGKDPVARTVEKTAVLTFGISREEAIQKRICVRCKGKAGLFRDPRSAKEYQQIGFCQKCQDEIFGEEEI